MRLLAIDTSTQNLSLAVSENGRIVREESHSMQKELSDLIVKHIGGILKRAKCPISKLDGFVVGLGPGSFTSLRVGLSTVKGLAFSTEKPVVAIPSLDAIASSVNQEDSPVCVLMDARRDLLYACLYSKKNGNLKRKSEYLLISIDELLTRIDQETILVGDGLALYEDKIRSKYPQNKRMPNSYWYPQAKWLISLARERFKKKDYDNPDDLIPLYLYPEDCQVQNR